MSKKWSKTGSFLFLDAAHVDVTSASCRHDSASQKLIHSGVIQFFVHIFGALAKTPQANYFIHKFSVVLSLKRGSFVRDGRQRQMRREAEKITFSEIGRQVKRLCAAVKCAQIQGEMGRNTTRQWKKYNPAVLEKWMKTEAFGSSSPLMPSSTSPLGSFAVSLVQRRQNA